MSASNWLRTATVQMDLSLKVVFRFGLSYENDLAFYPIPLRIRVHILQSAQAEHKTGTLISWWETPMIWTAGILQVHISCISGTACGTCIISTINGLTSQVLMFSEYQASCFWDKDSERKMTMIISSWKCCKILHLFFFFPQF